MNWENLESSQRSHYDKIGADYDTHYSDQWSLAYREEFLCSTMFPSTDLKNKKVLDALSGGGQLSDYLLKQGAIVSSLDISPVQIASLKRRCPDIEATVGSIFSMPFEDESFDAVGVCNGLHHLHPHLDQALKEIHRVLKPGGYFGFSEPAAKTLPDLLRQLWYRFDPLFEEGEAGVDLEELKRTSAHLFEFGHEVYLGNVAYIGVLNSMVLRLPSSWKRYYAPALIDMERVLNRILPKFFSCAAICSWQKPLN